jgi:hypothetical protein
MYRKEACLYCIFTEDCEIIHQDLKLIKTAINQHTYKISRRSRRGERTNFDGNQK